ncbi:MAG TPA: type I-C CRISPR-associated protein Cas7/Csd2 [Bacteroidales bacterium]|jgi:CRISPR-associated protein Csd2|nr:type I-C CRISPR-associated protein Cas7/Csd2 [Bacteroidales bacterium]HQJ82808.1 type I-C CRISPR-associated protein Cas7/Csd2 [Bacteroidales bacterium]
MESKAINNRYDFVFLFDVKDGNPNGDPDQANLPRVDAENQEGLVTDVCIKRKVRNYVQLKHELKSPYDIFIRQGNVLAKIIDEIKKDQNKNVDRAQKKLNELYFDIRTFGGVLSVGKEGGAGTVRGPVQFTFSRSADRVYQAEHSITRLCVTTEEEAKKQETREHASTFGRKSTVPYALFRMHGFISAVDAQKTGFSDCDLDLLWEALLNAFEHDRAAARGEMNPRRLIIFKHDNHLGSARSGELFEKVQITKNNNLPRSWDDYSVKIDDTNLPKGVNLMKLL